MGNYIDINYIEERLNITIDDDTSPNTTQLNHAIDKAEFDFDDEFGIYREQVGIVEVIDGSYEFIYTKDSLPLTAISQIEVRQGTIFDPTWVVLTTSPATYVIYDSELGKIAVSFGVKGPQQYRVTYTGGYASVDMPGNIKDLIYYMAWQEVFNNTMLNTQGSGNTTETIDVDVYKEVTKGGSFYLNGTRDIDILVDNQKANFRGKLHTYLY